MQYKLRQTSQPEKRTALVKIPRYRDDANGAQFPSLMRVAHQGIYAVTGGKQFGSAQTNVAAADNKQSLHRRVV